MTIIPPVVLNTAQIVAGAVASARNAVELAKASSSHELKAAVSELYDSLLDVKARVLDLDEENRALRAAATEAAKYVGPIAPHGYFFSVESMEDPLCPKCFQARSRIISFMKAPDYAGNGRYSRQCPICFHTHHDNGAGLRK
jgi:hypothetical protein